MWLMLDVIVNITGGIATNSKAVIILFGQKSLNEMYLYRENIKRFMIDTSFITNVRNHLGVLPNNTALNAFK